MLPELRFRGLTWEQFEHLIASLLEAEGFVNVVSAGGSGGDMGLDIAAEEIRRSITGQVSTFRWMVQAKHYAGLLRRARSRHTRNVGHSEIADVITYLSEHKAHGFLLVTDTDLTASAVKKLTSFHEDPRHSFEAHFWNNRMLGDRLRRHPTLIERFFSGAKSSVSGTKLLSNPFKFLEPFGASDRQIFFGRDTEIAELAGLVHNCSTLLLFGESGTGKTSLLNAGLFPQLLDNHFLVASARCLDEPTRNIRREVLRCLEKLISREEMTEIGATSDLAEFLRRVRMLLDRMSVRMVIALDQLEEAFTQAGRHERSSLAEAVRAFSSPAVSRGSLTLLFSIREDYIGSFWDWSHRNRLSETWSNAYRIGRLGRDAASNAITKPIVASGRRLERELASKLVNALEKLGDGKIYPPYMQIVCGCLVDETEGNQEVTLSLFEEMGGCDAIIGDYLDHRMFTGLSSDYRAQAQLVLDALTGGEGLRTLLTLEEIQLSSGVADRKQASEILDFLMKRRVVVARMDAEQVQGYELVHDFLSRRFFERLSPTEKRERAIRDVFRRAFRDWKNHGILVSKAALDEFLEHRETLLLGNPQVRMILESGFASGKYGAWKKALGREAAGKAVDEIIRETDNPGVLYIALRQVPFYRHSVDLDSVLKCLCHSNRSVRYGATQALKRVGTAHLVPQLLTLARSEDEDTSEKAIKLLGHSKDRSTVSALIECSHDERPGIRAASVKALSTLKASEGESTFKKCLSDSAPSVKLAALDGVEAIKFTGALALVRRLLRDDDVKAVAKAARVLGSFGDSKAVPRLRTLLRSEAQGVVEAAAIALAHLRDPRAIPALREIVEDSRRNGRAEAITALMKLNDRASLPLLRTRLTDGTASVRDAAARAIAEFGDKDSIPVILELRRIDDRYYGYGSKSAYDEALERLGHKE